MPNYRMNGAGDDPVAFYAEVEPGITAIAERYSERRAACKTDSERENLRREFKPLFSELVGQRRQVRDCEAALSDLDPACDEWCCGIALIASKLPPPGDKRNRLYHWGAGNTIMDALDEQSA